MNPKQSFISKIKDTVGDVLSVRSRAREAARGEKYDSDRAILKDVKKYDNAPSFDDDGITDAGKMRTMAKIVRDRMTRK